MKKAKNIYELIASIRNGQFTLDGSHLTNVIDFDCSTASLNSLKGVPKTIGGDFDCHTNNLQSLKDGPEKVEGEFICNNNKLRSLEYAPSIVDGHLSCMRNLISSFKGIPQYIGGDINLYDNKITSFEGAPSNIHFNVFCGKNNFTTLHNIHNHIKRIEGGLYLDDNLIKECILGVLLIEQLSDIEIGANTIIGSIVNPILHQYLGKGKAGIYKCAQELIKAGYPELAKL